jgi:hypothetical protein
MSSFRFLCELVKRYVLALASSPPRQFLRHSPSTTGDGTGFPNCPRMNIISPGPVASLPM